MATLFNMYQDTPRTDISGQLTQLRREEKDRTDANWKGSKDLLRGAAVASIRKDYKNGIAWDDGVKSADDSFKRQYERMMVADPAAAQQLRQDYQEERTKRVNADVATEYKSKADGVYSDIRALEQEITQLESEIATEEAENARLAEEATKAVSLRPDQVPSSTALNAPRAPMPRQPGPWAGGYVAPPKPTSPLTAMYGGMT